MAVYLQITGVQGNATNVNYKNWIAVEHISWYVSNDVGSDLGSMTSRQGGGSISNTDVMVQKKFDNATVPLMKLLFAGKNLDSVKIAVTQSASDTGQAYLLYTLSNVILSSWNISAGGGDPMDSFSLNFTKIELTAQPTSEDNSFTQVVGGYDFKEVKPL